MTLSYTSSLLPLCYPQTPLNPQGSASPPFHRRAASAPRLPQLPSPLRRSSPHAPAARALSPATSHPTPHALGIGFCFLTTGSIASPLSHGPPTRSFYTTPPRPSAFSTPLACLPPSTLGSSPPQGRGSCPPHPLPSGSRPVLTMQASLEPCYPNLPLGGQVHLRSPSLLFTPNKIPLHLITPHPHPVSSHHPWGHYTYLPHLFFIQAFATPAIHTPWGCHSSFLLSISQSSFRPRI